MKKFKLMILLLLSCFFVSIIYAEPIWKDDFKEVENWYDNKTDSSFNAVIIPGKKKGTAEVKQKGKGNWGKVAFVLTNLDLDKYPLVKIKVRKVSKSGDFKVLAVSKDWGRSYVIIDRGAGKGEHKGDIKEVTGWTGKKTFNLVIVIEGKNKKVVLDNIMVTSK